MKNNKKFIQYLDRTLTDEEKIRFAEFVRKYKPAEYVYFEAVGATLNQNQMSGLLDFVRGVGNFVSGLFGSGVQKTYQEFVQWDKTGISPVQQPQQLSAEQVRTIQREAVEDALQQERQENFQRMLPVYGILAVLAFKVLK